MERPQTGQDRSSTSKVIRLNTFPAGQRYAMGMPSYFSSLSMLNAKKPLPHHHDMQGKTILAFRRIVLLKKANPPDTVRLPHHTHRRIDLCGNPKIGANRVPILRAFIIDECSKAT